METVCPQGWRDGSLVTIRGGHCLDGLEGVLVKVLLWNVELRCPGLQYSSSGQRPHGAPRVGTDGVEGEVLAGGPPACRGAGGRVRWGLL